MPMLNILPKQRKGKQFLEPLLHKSMLETKMAAYNGKGKKNNQSFCL